MNANEMHPASEIDTMSARRALQCALASLDNGHPTAAEAWAETAADIIREGQITASQQRQLVAPKDGPTKGDMAAVAVSMLVIVWLVFDSLRTFL